MKFKIEAPNPAVEGQQIFDDAYNDWRQTATPRVTKAADVWVSGVKSMLSRTSTSPAPQGAPPAFVTGNLYRSVRRLAVRSTKWSRRSGIHIDHEGANRLEFGTTDSRGVTTYPHPFWRPVRAATEKLVEAILMGNA